MVKLYPFELSANLFILTSTCAGIARIDSGGLNLEKYTIFSKTQLPLLLVDSVYAFVSFASQCFKIINSKVHAVI